MSRPVSNFWTREEVIAALQRFGQESGEPRLNVAAYDAWSIRRPEIPSKHTIYQLFGSWPSACQAAGLRSINKPRQGAIAEEGH